jgi:hypothetical protein
VCFSGFGIHTEYDLHSHIGIDAIEVAQTQPTWLFGVDAFERPDVVADYQHALEGLSDPSHTILAVDRPYLVDYRRFDLPSLDLPGWVAPGGRFPFFRGPAAKVGTLLRAGFTTLVATDPRLDLCLKPSFTRLVAPYDRYHEFYDDWTRDLTEVGRRAPSAVHRFGSLLVIDLRRARADLRR